MPTPTNAALMVGLGFLLPPPFCTTKPGIILIQDVLKRVALMLHRINALILPIMRPNPPRQLLLHSHRCPAFAFPDDPPNLLQIVGQLHQKMTMRRRHRNDENAMRHLFHVLANDQADPFTQLLRDDNRFAANRLAVTMQPGVFARRRRILVIAGGVDLVIDSPKSARIARQPAVEGGDYHVAPALAFGGHDGSSRDTPRNAALILGLG